MQISLVDTKQIQTTKKKNPSDDEQDPDDDQKIRRNILGVDGELFDSML